MSADCEQGGVRASEDDHLIGLLRREGRHSGVWFGHHLLIAADRLEELTATPATDTPEVVRLREALRPFTFEGVPIHIEWDRNAYLFTDALTQKSFTIGEVLDVRAALAKHPTSPEDAA